MTDRRAFIDTLPGGLLAAPLAAEAQPPVKIPRLCNRIIGTASYHHHGGFALTKYASVQTKMTPVIDELLAVGRPYPLRPEAAS